MDNEVKNVDEEQVKEGLSPEQVGVRVGIAGILFGIVMWIKA